jgi:hypothetical protein
MLGVRIIYIVQPPLFSLKHYPRALRTKHSLNESNVFLQHTLLAQFYIKSIFKTLHISSVHLLALIPAVQNQLELHRLKYVSPLLRAPTCFKRYNPLACRVTSR